MPALLTTMSMRPKVSTAVRDDPARRLEVAHRVVVGHGVAARRLDLLAHLRGGVLAGALTTEGHADVVDHDLGPLARPGRGRCRARCPDPHPSPPPHDRPEVPWARQYLAAPGSLTAVSGIGAGAVRSGRPTGRATVAQRAVRSTRPWPPSLRTHPSRSSPPPRSCSRRGWSRGPRATSRRGWRTATSPSPRRRSTTGS